MSHTLQVEVSDELYVSLTRLAEQSGLRPEDLAAQWLVSASRNVVDDPVEPFIGAFPSNVPDWAGQHDKYIGQAILESSQDVGSSSG